MGSAIRKPSTLIALYHHVLQWPHQCGNAGRQGAAVLPLPTIFFLILFFFCYFLLLFLRPSASGVPFIRESESRILPQFSTRIKNPPILSEREMSPREPLSAAYGWRRGSTAAAARLPSCQSSGQAAHGRDRRPRSSGSTAKTGSRPRLGTR
eukprot:364362-Chlamydomonas_euryale.AAC.37